MEFFRKRTNIDFLGIRNITWILSVLMVVLSFGALAVKGLNWGLDFTGGYAVEVHYPTAPSLDKIRKDLSRAGFSHVSVITFGASNEIMLRMAPDSVSTANLKKGELVQQALRKQLGVVLGSDASIANMDYVGPEVGEELAQRGLLAMLVAIIVTMIYIAFRFESRFAFSSAVALAHDPIIILGIFAYYQIPFGLNALAAILAVIGYSLNDTVVVYDRVRENFRNMRKAGVVEVVNRAINDTLSRTIMTSGLTLLVVVVLYIVGGPSIHDFSLALIIGVVVGTYSSIYVAGALAVLIGLSRDSLT